MESPGRIQERPVKGLIGAMPAVKKPHLQKSGTVKAHNRLGGCRLYDFCGVAGLCDLLCRSFWED